MWYLYIIRCSDNSLYTGITTDYERRFREHSSGKGAKYTRARGVISIEGVMRFETRSEASKKEYEVKRLKKLEKEALIDSLEKIFLKK